MNGFQRAATEWAERGAFVFPLRSSKKPREKGWRECGATPEQIANWGPDVTGYGIDCESAGLVVLDEDRPGAIAEVEERLGVALPPTLTITTGRVGGGQHRIFTWEHQSVRIGNREPDGWPQDLNVRGAGGYIVGPCSEHFDSHDRPTGNWYEASDLSPARLPDAVAKWLSGEAPPSVDHGGHPKAEQGEDLKVEQYRPARTEADREWGREYLRKACEHIRLEREGARNQTLRDAALPVGSLVKAGYLDPHEATDGMTEAATDAGLPEYEVRATIANAANDARSDRGPRPLRTADEMFDDLTPQEAGHADASEAVKLEQAVRRELLNIRARDEARRRYDAETGRTADSAGQYLTLDDLDALPPMPWFIGGRLPEGYALLTGRDGTFKTFIALDMVLSIAAGIPWQGRPVTRARVLYVAGEGARNISNRISAWLKTRPQVNRTDLLAWFTVRSSAPNFYAAGPGYDDLLQNASGFGVVVLDTLRRISGGADGNGSDMAVVVDRIADLIRVLNNGSGGLALVVAHTQKNDTDTRGYSGIEDDADAVLHTNREGASMRVTLEVAKQKDGDDGGKDQLTLQAVAVTAAESSLAVSPSSSLQMLTHETRKQERERLIIEHLDAVRNIGAGAGEVVSALGGQHNRTTVSKHLSELLGKGRISKQGQRYYPGSPTAAADALGFTDEPDPSDSDNGAEQ